ncbi:hypothetical protein RO3G_05612 [Rhizopus delemar RA 99-880]|uniref:Uncharacterized protein n=1 Tax=Rhizopus delemar (strain RA 99-880 / ATCC MYA-4621 / FGSC 9543 / NRRL 43880) TaxID=246409 RepID=I1BXH7_RHIO9|nr:hypothetical protein RO3G_05612 [Rhizopus delemar RA 99-880]|eukprot:EIE80907.1 hypothetical protein RO3G_05612 [Rhizopus delemar RA 99-880]
MSESNGSTVAFPMQMPFEISCVEKHLDRILSNVFSYSTIPHALFQLNFPFVSASSLDISSAAIVGYTLFAV